MGNNSMNTMKKKAAAAALAAGLLGGGAAGMILGSTGVSGAQETTTTVEQQAGDSGQSDATTSDAGRPDISEHFTSALAPLVEDGTITQAQADAVIAALAEAGPPEGGDHGGRGGMGRGGPGLDSAAEALGITADELRTELEGGATIAEVAAAKGVDVQTVIDAMVAGVKAHLDEEVASGEHTQAEADEKLADATQRITDSVNNGMPERGERPADDTQEDAAN